MCKKKEAQPFAYLITTIPGLIFMTLEVEDGGICSKNEEYSRKYHINKLFTNYADY